MSQWTKAAIANKFNCRKNYAWRHKERAHLMNHFSIILISSSIQQVRSALPLQKIFTYPPPQQPGEEPQQTNNPFIAVEVALPQFILLVYSRFWVILTY